MTYFNSPEVLREWFEKYRNKKKTISHMFREELEEQ